ncbi:MAG: hypothetical protein KDC53_12330 [Saprospiraceae bacterium]|nr:hypothetical protein [Saprospiraceae bacterium]
MKLLNILFLSLTITGIINAQSDQRIGTWKSYLPYRLGLSVTQSPEAVYYGTEWALLKINKEDLSLEYYSKVEGLHDIGVQALKYDDTEKVLIVIYQNSNIDLVFSDEIVNLNQIEANTQIVEDRTIYDVFVQYPYAYLACGFGVVQLDIESREFGFTTFTNTPVRSIIERQNTLVISTDLGIYEIEENQENNLADFGEWHKLGFAEGLPQNHVGQRLALIDNVLYAGVNNELYRRDDLRFEFVHQENGYAFQFATAGPEGILTGWLCENGCNGKKILLQSDGHKKSITNCSNKTTNAVVDESGRVWYADDARGYKYSEGFEGNCQTIIPDRPPTHNTAQIAAHNQKLYVATGGVTINYGYLFRTEGFYTNESGSWQSFNKNNVSELNQRDMRDFLAVEVGSDGTVYVGTFWDGLIQYKNENFTVFDDENSSLQNSVINPDRNRITDMSFDQNGNLWILNHDAPRPVSVYTREGEWKSFSLPTSTNPEHIAIDNAGFKWISVGGVGLVVFDSGADPLSTSDDQYRVFNSNNSGLTVNSINHIAADKNGGVWVGTTEGVVFFNCGNFPFEDNCQGKRPIVEQNGIAGVLLGEENIKAIAIDGANQKWFGTNNGVFVQSEDIETQVFAFNTKNSPLFDNGIIDIAIDNRSGEVFIATNRGIQSYRGAAIDGGIFHESQITVFPNPVRPNYQGPIAIRGLAENANVKITDVSGLLVYETTALGGQAIWDGNDLRGRRVSSGVYLVFSAASQNQFNPDAAITKIMLVN